MPIIYPDNRQQIVDRVSTDIQNELPESEPFLRNSYLRSLAIGYSGAAYDIYKTIQALQQQMFPDTATGEFADRWAAFKGIFRNPATQSIGNITVTGIVSTIIPLSTELQSSDGVIFTTQSDGQILTHGFSTTLTRSGSTVTATTASDHHYADGNNIVIVGADQSEYNGTFSIVVTSATTFTYQIIGTPVTPATGSITSSFTYANIPIKSISYGTETNLISGSELFFSSVIPGIDNSAFVQFGGLTGGEDLESDDDFKKRYLYAYQHPISYFNVSEITSKCQEINGVVRVFVEEITPDVGQVTIYFMRDNDTNPIPTPSQVTEVKNHLLTIKPAHVDPNDVIVSAPTPVQVAFIFSFLNPNTTTMQNAITANLQAFFQESPIVGQNITKHAYESVISSTIDPATGNYVTDFVLTSPTTDIAIASGQIAVLGGISW